MEKITFTPFAVGELMVDGATINTLSLVGLSGMYAEARATMRGVPIETAIKRLRMLRQVTYTLQGKAVAMRVEDILQMPIAQGRKISAAVDLQLGGAGKIVRDGDGITNAIGFELASPVAMGGTNKDPIKEIEFLAKTYGDIEAVLAADDPIAQGVELLRTIAKPVHPTLTNMPDGVLNMILVGDGISIIQKIMPRFLSDSEEVS